MLNLQAAPSLNKLNVLIETWTLQKQRLDEKFVNVNFMKKAATGWQIKINLKK